MAVNWRAGLMRWKPYVDAQGKAYPLNHLHPIRYSLEVVSREQRPFPIGVAVGFGLHCFTRKRLPADDEASRYGDDRETRTFCLERYALSRCLPEIARSLSNRRCAFAKNDNFITVDVQTEELATRRYGVFFNLRRQGNNEEHPGVLLVIQSAYALGASSQVPGRGTIRLSRLVELTLQGIKPRPPES